MLFRVARSLAIHVLTIASLVAIALWVRSYQWAEVVTRMLTSNYNGGVQDVRSFVSYRGRFWINTYITATYDHAGNLQKPPAPAIQDGPRLSLSSQRAKTPEGTIYGRLPDFATGKWGFHWSGKQRTDPVEAGTSRWSMTVRGSPYWPWVVALSA